jgi:hypothetical protein
VAVQSLRSWWQTPVFPAALIAILAIICGYNRDFGLFFFLILLAPVVLLLLAVWGAAVCRAFKCSARRREGYLAIAIAMAAPALGVLMERAHDQVRFLAWAPFHLDLINRKPEDGIVAKWDIWGGLGWFNASYLARDGADRIKSLDEANAWGKSLGLSCEIVDTERVWRTLYVVTTYECEF